MDANVNSAIIGGYQLTAGLRYVIVTHLTLLSGRDSKLSYHDMTACLHQTCSSSRR